jgi:CTP:molybdopterin cytidylyltransferase MocA
VKCGAANTFGAVIAAAGLSGRMGAFKPLLPLGNSTIIERIIHTLTESGVEDIAVVTGQNAALLEQALADYNISFIYNKDYAVTDMFHSASMGLAFMAERVDCIFFTPVDVPLFSAATVRILAGRIQNSNDHIISPSYKGKSGHPIVMRSSAVKELTGLKNDRGLRGAIEAYNGPKGTIEVDESGILYDADTPDDYQFLVQRSRSRDSGGR